MTKQFSNSTLHIKMIPQRIFVHAVCTNTSFWGEDLTQISGFEAAVCNYLTQIRENGAYEVMKALA